MGSNPVASTTVLTDEARSVGNGQKSYFRYAWEGLEKSRPFPIFPAYRGDSSLTFDSWCEAFIDAVRINDFTWLDFNI